MPSSPETPELYRSHIPALHVLMAMGYQYLKPNQTLTLRGGKTTEVLLRDVLIDELKKRSFTHKGQSHPLSTNAIDQILRELSSPALNEGLAIANERMYDKLTFGITVTEFVDGNKVQPTIAVIDWRDTGNNQFHVSDEFEVARNDYGIGADGTTTARPDIICFINGIPVAVIEAKKADDSASNKNMLAEAISQHIRNQKTEYIPSLFAYAQLLFAVDGFSGKYGTTKTEAKFWAIWKDKDKQFGLGSAFFKKIKNKKLNKTQMQALFGHRPAKIRDYFETQWRQPQLPSGQDTTLISLLWPGRLLEFIRFYLLFDQRKGKIAARYQQMFGVKHMLARINQHNTKGGREGGVIWHTTGSGKSFSMVFLCKALLLHSSLYDCRIIVVTDRISLEGQLSRTFLSSGAFGSHIATKKEGEHARALTGRDLAKRIGQGSERIIFTIIDKFTPAASYEECKNESPDIIVLVDEGHRSHDGETHQRMRKALPNAAYIAFTGTPLLKNDKTENTFGPILHAYTMRQAVEDKAVTPLLYEEHVPELELSQKAIDAWFDRITHDLSKEQKADLKRKYAKKGAIYRSANRIELIAWAISRHFSKFKQMNPGMKGQLAAASKITAIRYHRYLQEIGEIASRVVISPPDTRKEHEKVDQENLPEIQQWWRDNVAGLGEQPYIKNALAGFGSDGPPDLLIVVDKLLTGFDEPRNSVLYIDEALEQHTLLQAIARVNRLHEKKQYGYLIDFRGILKKLDTAMQQYQDLEARTQGGYDIEDIEGMYHQVNTEYKRLPMLHRQLTGLFKDVKNIDDYEQLRQVLMPHPVDDSEGNPYDTRQKTRDDFYEALTEYGLCLKTALSSTAFFEDTGLCEDDIRTYKNDLKKFQMIRNQAKRDAQETVQYTEFEKQIDAMVDKYVVGVQVHEPQATYDAGKLGQEDPAQWSKEKTRNETDLIRTRIKRSIDQDLADDPYAQNIFAELLIEAIQEAEALFDHPEKQYALFKELKDKVDHRDIGQIPDVFGDNQHARAYYGIFRQLLGDPRFDDMDDTEHGDYIDLAFKIDEITVKAVAEHSVNPQNIEAEIRRGLLPLLFKQLGMDTAKDYIEKAIHIMRVGLAKENGGNP